MEDRRFDELAQRLAKPVSRRSVLGTLIAAVTGGIIAEAKATGALANNSACAHFCHTFFSGEDAGDCTSDGAHGSGLCHSACGPDHASGTSGVLCGAQSNGQYTSYSGTHCCQTGSATPGCCGNTCVSLSTSANCSGCGVTCAPANAVSGSCSTGSCVATSCKAGYGLSNGACGACGPGTYSPGGTAACAPCASGSYATGSANTTCTSCSCSASDQCHAVGACDPHTGMCASTNKTNGTPCTVSMPAACTVYTCQNGVCTGSQAAANTACGSGGVCCGGTCKQNDASNCGTCGAVCAANETCTNGACTCGTHADCAHLGQSCCDGTCVDQSSDPNNCGGCGHVCPSGSNSTPVCTNGTCGIVCSPGYADCNHNPSDGCETSLNTTSNCGACGSVCAPPNATGTCTNGTCQIAICNPGYADCDGNSSNGCETPLNTTSNCGGCGITCTNAHGTTSCSGGVCQPVCAPGYGDCDGNPANGCETALNTTSNCGACGFVCAPANATGTCNNGTCQIASCNSGYADCDNNPANGCETPLNTTSNCGACGAVCAPADATGACISGTCQIASCNAGYADCDHNAANGCETPLNTTSNCGGCGHVCPSGPNSTAACISGACGLVCSPGYADCDGNPNNGCEVQISSDRNNCGGCGIVCAPGKTCCNGGCTDLSSDPSNCNLCGNICVTGETCNNGNCMCGATACGGCNAACVNNSTCTCSGGTTGITTAGGTTTCVRPCSNAGQCQGGDACGAEKSGGGYCYHPPFAYGNACNSDVDCPVGSFCSPTSVGGPGACVQAAC